MPLSDEELSAALDKWDTAAGESLTGPDIAKGIARSYANGALLGNESRAESFLGGDYPQGVDQINQEQGIFQKHFPITAGGTELFSTIFANPLNKLGGIFKAAKLGYGADTATKILTSQPAQGAILGISTKAPDESALGAGLEGAAVGGAGSMIGSALGTGLEKAAENAVRLKLSAFGFGSADIAKQVKKLGTGIFDDTEVPLVHTVDKAEQAGLINAGDSSLKNAFRVHKAQGAIWDKLQPVLDSADAVIPPSIHFDTPHAEAFISGLSGTKKIAAENEFMDEIEAIQKQMANGGTLADLQDMKVGLNGSWLKNPNSDTLIKAIRSDLRAEIENRVNNAVATGNLDPKLGGTISKLNAQWGSYNELKNVLMRKIGKDYGPDVLDSAFKDMATTQGAGSMNIISAITGNPLYAALGAVGTIARTPEWKSSIADSLREFKAPLGFAGRVLSGDNAALGTSPLTGASSVELLRQNDLMRKVPPVDQPIGRFEGDKTSPQPQVSDDQLLKLLDDYQKKNRVSMTPDQQKEIEGKIDADPYYSALYQTESSRNPLAKNPKSSAKGGFQFINDTAQRLGLKDPFDLSQAFDAVQTLTDQNKKILKTDDPESLYGAHVLGPDVYSRWKADQSLSEKEQLQVDQFKNLELPRFLENYSALADKNGQA